MVVEIYATEKVEKLFEGWQETMIWSCLQKVMGKIYVNSEAELESAMAQVGDFCFLAGKANEDLLRFWSEQKKDYLIMVPSSKEWADLIEAIYIDRATKKKRYAIKKEENIFDKEKLQEIVDNLSLQYSMKLIDESLYKKCKEEQWSKDLVAQYDTYEMYGKLGVGVAILENDKLVAGASSYSSYEGGIEIEIDTKEEYRRKGLASICGAKLILECLERGFYPSWDAANLWSVGLAEKLGYHFDHEYTVYEVKLK